MSKRSDSISQLRDAPNECLLMKFEGTNLICKDKITDGIYNWDQYTHEGMINQMPTMLIRYVQGFLHQSIQPCFRILGTNLNKRWCIQVLTNTMFHIPYQDHCLFMIEERSDNVSIREVEILDNIIKEHPEETKVISWIDNYNRIKAFQSDDFKKEGIFISHAGLSQKLYLKDWYNRNKVSFLRKVVVDFTMHYSRAIPEFLAELMCKSEKVICILDEFYFKSSWCLAEARMCYELQKKNVPILWISLIKADDIKKYFRTQQLEFLCDLSFNCINEIELTNILLNEIGIK
jgi:hypothetical protein